MTTTTRNDRGLLFPGERRNTLAGLPFLAYHRAGEPARPLLVFLTGGGILARVAYGHPGADHRDFPDHWLARRGWGLLAPSYPSDHPAAGPAAPGLGIAEWAQVIARATAQCTQGSPDRPIVVAAWSMGGKLAFALTRALRELGLIQACLISLAATPPFPGLAQRMATLDRVTASGLRTLSATDAHGATREDRWQAELTAIGAGQGRPVIEPDALRSLYRCAIPPRLCGPETEPVMDGGPATDLRADLLAASSFTVADYPLCACVVPCAATDPQHALTDEATWAGVTTRGLAARHIRAGGLSQLSDADWAAFRRVVVTAPPRLTRHVDGGHFFFLGERGARATVAAIAGLTEEAAGIMTAIERVLPRHHRRPVPPDPVPPDPAPADQKAR